LESFRRHGPDVLAELERAAGLVHYRALAEDCPADERLKLALARAQADHDALAPEQRAWSPLEAISELARIVATFAAVAGTAFDLELVEQLPSIEPLAPLSPAVEVVQRLVESIRHHQSGRFEAAHRMQCSILERIQQP